MLQGARSRTGGAEYSAGAHAATAAPHSQPPSQLASPQASLSRSGSVVLAAAGPAALKTHELFTRWLSLPATQRSVGLEVEALLRQRWSPSLATSPLSSPLSTVTGGSSGSGGGELAGRAELTQAASSSAVLPARSPGASAAAISPHTPAAGVQQPHPHQQYSHSPHARGRARAFSPESPPVAVRRRAASTASSASTASTASSPSPTVSPPSGSAGPAVAGITAATSTAPRQPSAASLSPRMQRRMPPGSAGPSKRVPSGASAKIPAFYFGSSATTAAAKTAANQPAAASAATTLRAFETAFGGRPLSLAAFEPLVTKLAGWPLYWAGPLFHAALVHSSSTSTTTSSSSSAPLPGWTERTLPFAAFARFWSALHAANLHDQASRFLALLAFGKDRAAPPAWRPLLEHIVLRHPGLAFLKDASEFQPRYVDTVIARIFFCVNRSWSGAITAAELARSNFLETLASLEHQPDINQISDYFSYEHFYVIYTTFWKLDTDRDMRLTIKELGRYNDDGLSTRVLDRLFQKTVQASEPPATASPRQGPAAQDTHMSYMDFCRFILAEEDKTHPTAIEYWFRVLDLDGDGLISMFEMEHFYEEQLQRLEELAVEALDIRDCLCQILDMIKPRCKTAISLSDIKRSKQATLFFNTFTNINKFLDYEERDQFQVQREREAEGDHPLTDWERFAKREYDYLAAEDDEADNSWSDSDDGDEDLLR